MQPRFATIVYISIKVIDVIDNSNRTPNSICIERMPAGQDWYSGPQRTPNFPAVNFRTFSMWFLRRGQSPFGRGDFNAGGRPPSGGAFSRFFSSPPDFNAGGVSGRGFQRIFKKNDRKNAKIAPAARVYCLFYAYIGLKCPKTHKI